VRGDGGACVLQRGFAVAQRQVRRAALSEDIGHGVHSARAGAQRAVQCLGAQLDALVRAAVAQRVRGEAARARDELIQHRAIGGGGGGGGRGAPSDSRLVAQKRLRSSA
jgi:hypothetical protein